jgi:hypothetical protein
MTQDDRTMPVNQAQKYMNELRARKVPYSFQPFSHGLITVSTRGAFAVDSYEAFLAAIDADMETWEERFPEGKL